MMVAVCSRPVAQPATTFAAPSKPAAIADHEAPLIRRAQAGDRDAFGELYRRHEGHVRRYLASRLRNRKADVDDLLAETFLVAMQRIASFQLERPGEFGNWLVGIARNKLLGWVTRTANRETALDERWSVASSSVESVSPEEVALARLEVADALSRLTSRARRALVLQHAVGMPTAEVALALGTTKRSVWGLTSRARCELRGEVKRCACGCGAAIRPERWGRDRYASWTCRRQTAVAAPALCACGCGTELPAVRPSRQRYATRSCRNRAAWQRRQEAQRRYLAGPVTADPAVERALAVVRAAGCAGLTRSELSRRTRLLAARLDRAIDLLASRWLISGVLVPGDGRQVMRYRVLSDMVAGKAA